MAKYTLEISKSFKKSFKKLSHKEREAFYQVSQKLLNGEELEAKYRDHPLKGRYIGFRECHLKPDLLLVYKIEDAKLILYCLDIGSHGDLF